VEVVVEVDDVGAAVVLVLEVVVWQSLASDTWLPSTHT
jgi:hypothetical protein